MVEALAQSGAIEEAIYELRYVREPGTPFNGYRDFAVVAVAEGLVAAGQDGEVRRLVQRELAESAYPERFRQSYRDWLSGGSRRDVNARSVDNMKTHVPDLR